MSVDDGSRNNDSPDLTLLTDRELRAAWRASHERLRRLEEHSDAVGAARVTHERACYLDELQRRDPEHFASWLVSGGPAPKDRTLGLNRLIPQQRRPADG